MVFAMIKILSFGSLNIDYVYSVDHFVRPGETIKSYKKEVFCGGKGLNQSIALKRANANVYHAGCIGNNGDILRNALCSEQINIDYIYSTPIDTGHAMIQVDQNGENSIILYQGANGCITEDQIASTLANFHQGDFLVLQNEINNLDCIMRSAHNRGLRIFFNPSPINDSLMKLPLEYVDYFILNQIEAKDILHTTSDENLLDQFSKRYPNAHIILTLGGNGVQYQYQDTTITHGAYCTTITDTTAAGDTFTGYFIAQLASGISTAVALTTASKAAALAISRKGATPSIPYMEEVLQCDLQLISDT